MDSGAQCVMTVGIQETQMWLVDNLDFLMESTTVQAVMQGKISSIEYNIITRTKLLYCNILAFDKQQDMRMFAQSVNSLIRSSFCCVKN